MPGAARTSCKPLASQRNGSANPRRCRVTGWATEVSGAGCWAGSADAGRGLEESDGVAVIRAVRGSGSGTPANTHTKPALGGAPLRKLPPRAKKQASACREGVLQGLLQIVPQVFHRLQPDRKPHQRARLQVRGRAAAHARDVV